MTSAHVTALMDQLIALTERQDSLLASIASTEGQRPTVTAERLIRLHGTLRDGIRITADRLMYGGAP